MHKKYIAMEIKIINQLFDVETNAIHITKVSEENMTLAKEFVINYAIEYKEQLNDNLFICYQNSGNSTQILGIFSFKENIPSVMIDDGDVNCNELRYIIANSIIMNFKCLQRLFSIIFSLLVNRKDNKDEMFWANYQTVFYGKRIDKLFKIWKEYYFQNESTYFASTIVKIKQQTDNNHQRINSLLKQITNL